MVKQALIIAAGTGSRLQKDLNDPNFSKPLEKILGLSIIKRAILNLAREGIKDIHIVTGHNNELLENALKNEDFNNQKINLNFIYNKEYLKPNGLSVLAAKNHIKEKFVLLMSDHVFDYRALPILLDANQNEEDSYLMVDHKVNAIFDIDDATKVVIEKSLITEIGKDLTSYSAIDTGIFLLSPKIFDALTDSIGEGNYSLSGGIKKLSDQKLMHAVDIKNFYWQDIDTKESKKHAEKLMLKSLRKPTDGVVSRHINRFFSLKMSKVLVNYTNATPNHISILALIVGLVGAFIILFGTYWCFVISAILLQISSILDGTDGEIAKLRLTLSLKGEWFDTVCDRITQITWCTAVFVGFYVKTGNPIYLYLGIPLNISVIGVNAVILWDLKRKKTSGSALSFGMDYYEKTKQGNTIAKLLRMVAFTVRRDFYTFLFVFLAIFNLSSIIIVLLVLALSLTTVGVFLHYTGLYKRVKPDKIELKSKEKIASAE